MSSELQPDLYKQWCWWDIGACLSLFLCVFMECMSYDTYTCIWAVAWNALNTYSSQVNISNPREIFRLILKEEYETREYRLLSICSPTRYSRQVRNNVLLCFIHYEGKLSWKKLDQEHKTISFVVLYCVWTTCFNLPNTFYMLWFPIFFYCKFRSIASKAFDKSEYALFSWILKELSTFILNDQ